MAIGEAVSVSVGGGGWEAGDWPVSLADRQGSSAGKFV